MTTLTVTHLLRTPVHTWIKVHAQDQLKLFMAAAAFVTEDRIVAVDTQTG